MAKFDPCVCCGGDCCTDGAHPDLPPAGTKVNIANVNMQTGGFLDNEWMTVHEMTVKSGQSWGWNAFNIVPGNSCEANYSVRWRFTDLCIPESQVDPARCGTCTNTAENFYNVASGYICEGVTKVIPAGGPFAFFWSCKYRKAQLQVKFDWSCKEWENPSNFLKCSDGQQAVNITRSVVIPADPAPGIYPIDIVPVTYKGSCAPIDMCAAYNQTMTVQYSGGPLRVDATRLRTYFQVTSFSPPGTTCIAINNAKVGFGGVPFCEADCSFPPCYQGKMGNWIYNTLYQHFQCRTGDALFPCGGPFFPTDAVVFLQLGFFCCDASFILNWRLWYEISRA